jgi:UDPglucose 6-dehydrogenase
MARILILGAGVVGEATSEGFASHGHEVTLVDHDPERVRHLQGRGLHATGELDLSGPSTIVFLALPTPAGPSGFDLSALLDGVTALGIALRQATNRHVVAVRSTVPPFTTNGLVIPRLEELSRRRAASTFAVAYVPEFLRAASALEDFLSPKMTVIACRDDEARAQLEELFGPFGGELRTFGDPTTAEMIKLAQNAFNATKISFWNEMWRLCQRVGIDADEVATTVAYAAEGSLNPAYGIRGGYPFAGGCLPKDVRGLLRVGDEIGVELPLLGAVRQVNETVSRESVQESITPDGQDAAGPG